MDRQQQAALWPLKLKSKATGHFKTVHQLAESLGNLFVETFHYLALFAIGAVTAYAAVR